MVGQISAPRFRKSGSGVLAVTFEALVMPGILFAVDPLSRRRSQSDPSLELMPGAKFASTGLTGCVSEPGWACSVRSSEEAELLAGRICARTAAKGVVEPSSQTLTIKCRVRNVNFTSCPKGLTHRSRIGVRASDTECNQDLSLVTSNRFTFTCASWNESHGGRARREPLSADFA